MYRSPRLSLWKTTVAIKERPTSAAAAAISQGQGVEPIGRPVRRAQAAQRNQSRKGIAASAPRMRICLSKGRPIEPLVQRPQDAGGGAPDVPVLVGGGVEAP